MPETASLIRFAGSGCLGIPLPETLLREHDLTLGDYIVLLPHKEDDGFTLYLPPGE